MKKTQQILVIGVKNGQKGQLISNPPVDYMIQSDDYLVIIAWSKINNSFVFKKYYQQYSQNYRFN